MKGEMDVLGSPSLIVLINGLCGRKATLNKRLDSSRAQALRESRGGRPGLPIPVDVKQH